MSDKVTMNIDLRNVQEQVEDGVKQAQTFGRKAVLAYAGMWGLAYDKAQELWAESGKLLEKAEKRGEDIEAEWMQQFNKVQEKPEIKRVVVYVEDQVDHVSKNAKSVVAEVEKFLGQFQPAMNNVQSAMKDVAIEVQDAVAEAKDAVVEAKDAVVEAVIDGYEEMPAKDVIAMLPTLPKDMLAKVREYEAGNKNRVTVLREIDALLDSATEQVEAVTA